MKERKLRAYCLEQAIKLISCRNCLGRKEDNPIELATGFYDYMKGKTKKDK